MRVYTQLTQEQRYQIYALMKAEHKQTEIAAIVGVDKSTTSREVRRNRGLRGYRPQQAHQFALHRRQAKARPRITPAQWGLIERLLREDWSPLTNANSFRRHLTPTSFPLGRHPLR